MSSKIIVSYMYISFQFEAITDLQKTISSGVTGEYS